MQNTVSKKARAEVLGALRVRYRQASKDEKTKVLDEFVAVAGCHRKHAIRLLTANCDAAAGVAVRSRRTYDEAVREALIVLWEAADRICGKRLKAVLPSLVAALEQHGHLGLDAAVRQRLLSASAATIDRLLAGVRNGTSRRKKRKRSTKPTRQVPIRTFADWKEPLPGYLEIDFVAHGGSSVEGTFVWSLAATDVCTGWTEVVPLVAREQSLVAEGLAVMRRQFAMPILGIDTDNDGAFINETLLAYCQQQKLEFTRSRAYQKNDQAWIEQKNGSVVRRFVGYERFSGLVAGQCLAQLFQAVRLYVNYFPRGNRHWPRLLRVTQGLVLGGRVWSSFSRNSPSSGVPGKPGQRIDKRNAGRTGGEPGKIPLTACGQRFSCGYRRIPILPANPFWTGCTKNTRADSRGGSFGRCSVAFRNGGV